MKPIRKLKLGVLVSGRGSNLQAIIDASRTERIAAEVVVVIADKPQAYALERAKLSGIETRIIPYPKGTPREETESRIAKALKECGTELVVLAGFMKIITPFLINQFPHRIINIHPSLLPKYPGVNAQRQALEDGAEVSGCTVHVVDTGCDSGPIILQSKVPVLKGDTVEVLSARILKEEHDILPKAIDLFAKNKVRVMEGKVVIESENSQ